MINCYCFNKDCKGAIFSMGAYLVVKVPLEKVLSEPVYCKHCHEELIAKPVLEIKMQVAGAFDEKEHDEAMPRKHYHKPYIVRFTNDESIANGF